ncbi:glycoside hydrolase family 3 C-terminal domain-containing protein [Trichococcus flocculiformis]|uniref:glycoside hydrolase family 3 C-terminal domain-containing protein n=1 Tax=Trichococcus flocculiformis TaxID=82803 RepID=UPI003DA54FEF
MESNRLRELIREMTLEEKASLCSGLDFWNTQPIPRLGIPSIMMTDGPHGLRKQEGDADHLGLNLSIPATCFPSAVGQASSWDSELVNKVGKAIGREAQAQNISIVLGPGVNIKRSPLCGRNFEYYSEDPYLSSQLSTSFIKGVQSQGVGTSLKHFAVNNQEYKRMSIDAVVDEQALREIYLASFEEVVKEAKPWTIMAAYNKVNGDFCSENKRLLTDILREEWGYEGLVVSDWGAVNERDRGISAGLDLEMPSSNGLGNQKIVDAIRTGVLTEEELDQTVENVLTLVFKAMESKKKNATYDKEEHHLLAREAARESMILLKNEDQILPINNADSISVIGALAINPRYQGGGSSHINPTQLDDILAEIKKITADETKVVYSEGYSLEGDQIYESMVYDATEAAKQSDLAIIFAGLPDRYESEGFDRRHLQLPANQIRLIEAVAEVQKNVVVVLSNGAPIEMPWLQNVKAVLEGYLGGQALGGAIADLLFGLANPSGKLAETFPKKLAHNPSYTNYPGDGETVEYREGVFVGYRHYDTKDVEPLFPFGFGLSYTTFEYSDITVDKTNITDEEAVKVSVKVKNTGSLPGKEIVQLYVKDVESTVSRPEKELKRFEKISLQPNEEQVVTFELDKRVFSYYNVKLSDWHVESGDFEILVGKSSREIVLRETVHVESTVPIKNKLTRYSTLNELLEHPVGLEVIKEMGLDQIDEESGLGSSTQDLILGMTIHSLSVLSNGSLNEEMVQNILLTVNGADK